MSMGRTSSSDRGAGKNRGAGQPPIVDTTPEWIDHRVMVTPFSAEKTLTKDTGKIEL